jgi:hypothetical protein
LSLLKVLWKVARNGSKAEVETTTEAVAKTDIAVTVIAAAAIEIKVVEIETQEIKVEIVKARY